jgi:hypothetical protein
VRARAELEQELRRAHIECAGLRERNGELETRLRVALAALAPAFPKKPAEQADTPRRGEPPPSGPVIVRQTLPKTKRRTTTWRPEAEERRDDAREGQWSRPRLIEMDRDFRQALERERRPLAVKK